MKILITGARSGIGYASALELLNRGHFVYLTVHTESQLQEVLKKEELKGKNVEFLKLDITSKEDIDKVKDLDIDILINNASIGFGGSLLVNDVDKLRENYEVNVFGTLNVTKVFLEKMHRNKKGRIIMVSSILAEIPFAWLSFYSSGKAAIKNLALALNKELKTIKSKVKVTIIEPGAYRTGFNKVMINNKYDGDKIFENVKDKISKWENIKFNLLESDDIQTIVDKVIMAIESPRPRMIYKAPLAQSVMEKMYMIFKR